jgi:hypothetical protein
MPSDTCCELREAVEQSLDYLFDEFGFAVTAVKPTTSAGRCLIMLSSVHRLRIIVKRGDLEVAIGSLSGSAAWVREDYEQIFQGYV